VRSLPKLSFMRGTTFMSGTRHSDTHVQYELDTATWMGPFEPTKTPFAMVQEAADLLRASGLKAVALEDARPAQWSKTDFQCIGERCVCADGVAAQFSFGAENEFGDLGHLLRA